MLAAGKAEISVTHQSTLVSLAPEPESRLARAWAAGTEHLWLKCDLQETSKLYVLLGWVYKCK